jgi:hypothetical protein
MKRFAFIVYLILLLLIMVVPVTAGITKISPEVGYTGRTSTVTITGTNFTPARVVVMLTNGDDDITASVGDFSNTSIKCTFTISKTRATGDWDLIVTNNDGWEQKKSNGFTIRKPMTLTSISPTHAQANNDSVDFTLVGTYLSDVEDVFLYNNDYDNITATDVVGISATRVEGTFDLTDTDEDTYDVCVVDDFGTEECDLSFEITTDEVGSIDISSSPAGASIYVDGSYIGTTPDTADDLDEGSYKVVLRKSGYNDWGKIVKVKAGETTTVDADLDVMTTAPTAVPTTVPTTVRTTVKKSTMSVPTTWPSATPTQASPVVPAVTVGTICLAFIALRKH